MKAFIRWSGKRSKVLANALRDWLPCVMQYMEPFVSDNDHRSDQRGHMQITLKLAPFGPDTLD